jgi:plastocyanin
MVRRNLIVIAAVVVVVAVAAAAGFFLLAPSGPREVKLRMMEFGFNGPSGGPVIRAKVGETIRFVLMNAGGADHELMIVKDLDGFKEALHKTVNELKAKGLDQEAIEKSEEVEMLRHKYAAVELLVDGKREHNVELERGESVTLTVTFDRPGTYYYVCAELALTFPESHLDRGMYGTIIVEG